MFRALALLLVLPTCCDASGADAMFLFEAEAAAAKQKGPAESNPWRWDPHKGWWRPVENSGQASPGTSPGRAPWVQPPSAPARFFTPARQSLPGC